jgi:hypothetical protein
VKEMLSGDSETADSATEMPISSTEKAISVEHPGIVRRLSGASDRETVDSLPEAGVCSTETSGPISDPRANGAQGEKTAVEGWRAEPVVPPRIRPRHPQPRMLTVGGFGVELKTRLLFAVGAGIERGSHLSGAMADFIGVRSSPRMAPFIWGCLRLFVKSNNTKTNQ